MKLQLDRIENKLDLISDRLNNVDVTLASQHVSLADHIRRTELLEIAVAPLTKESHMIHGVLKAVGILSLLGGIGSGIAALLPYLRK